MCFFKRKEKFLARYDPYSLKETTEIDGVVELEFESHIYPRRPKKVPLKRIRTFFRKIFNI
tara:strand:- start:950 stop:1132 length:183 start_codon:yes stop_codon:yes gene_type:complete